MKHHIVVVVTLLGSQTMSEICAECKSEMELVDTHKSYISAVDYNVVKYYDCNNCNNQVAVEGWNQNQKYANG